MKYASPIQAGIFLTIEDGQLALALSFKNPTDEGVTYRSMSGAVFKPRIELTGGEVIWSPPFGATMAVNHHRLEPDGCITIHYDVQTKEQRREELSKINDLYPEHDFAENISETTYLEPQDIDGEIVGVSSVFPASSHYHTRFSRMYDLREPDGLRGLDDELPPEQTPLRREPKFSNTQITQGEVDVE